MTSNFSAKELEAGRILFAGQWEFSRACSAVDQFPPVAGIEIAFAGRSNVGKSSLINGLTGRKALARTSNTPGRTQELIFFPGEHGLTLVDMPGYGYAAVPKTKVEAWTTLIHDYLRGRTNLARVYVLIDSRHGLKDTDNQVFDTLGSSAVSHQIVLTKTDQISARELEQRVADTKAALARRAAAFPEILTTSSHTGTGIPELRAAIIRLMGERNQK